MFKKIFLLFNFTILFGQLDTLIVVDASDYNDWVYFSLETFSQVDISNPSTSLEWDLAFQRKHIRTNSGLSGPGYGSAAVDSSLSWIDSWNLINSIPDNLNWMEDDVLNDFYNPITHTFGEGIKSPPLNSWGWFDESYQLNPTHYALFVVAANGVDVVKIWPYGYYNQNGQGGHIQFRLETGYSIESQACDEDGLGDVNSDNFINVVDIVLIVDSILNSNENDIYDCAYDYNQDGAINVVDVVSVVNLILEI